MSPPQSGPLGFPRNLTVWPICRPTCTDGPGACRSRRQPGTPSASPFGQMKRDILKRDSGGDICCSRSETFTLLHAHSIRLNAPKIWCSWSYASLQYPACRGICARNKHLSYFAHAQNATAHACTRTNRVEYNWGRGQSARSSIATSGEGKNFYCDQWRSCFDSKRSN